MKKKTIGAAVCAVSLVLCLASCGGKAEQIVSVEQNTAAENETTLAKIEVASDGTYDTGIFSFKVPGNWLIVEQPDTLGEQDETGNYPIDAKSICIVKDGEDEFDAFFKHCVYIYYEEGEITDDVVETNISMYGEAEEFDLKINERECRAAHCIAEDGEYEYDIAFYPVDEEHYFEIIYTSIIPDDNEELRITDKDVISILSSLVLD